MKTTKEERIWLRRNWSVGETGFREWVAGSDHAHSIVSRLVDDVDALEEVLAEVTDELDSWHSQHDVGEPRVGWVLRMEESYQQVKAKATTALTQR